MSQVFEKYNTLDSVIAKKTETLENNKKEAEKALDLKIQESRTELDYRINKWKDQSQSIQDILSKQLKDSISVAENTIKGAKSTLEYKVANLKKAMIE